MRIECALRTIKLLAVKFNKPSLKSLLAKGYFPRELPPPFNTVSYAAHAIKVGKTWSQKSWTRWGAHNLARPGGLRRPLRIPNPMSYFGLAEVLANEWVLVRNHTWQVRLSVSRPQVIKKNVRAVVPRYRYAEVPRLRALRRRGARYLLCTDIDQFYPTIYTHTIPWALHTKAVCKAQLAKPGKGAHLVGNKIDKALRNINEGQTHGIPIGPDTSLVVAEILLAAVDSALLKSRGSQLTGFRYVDDYELAFATLSDAESVLTELQSILAEYELQLNPRKTHIQELPKALDDGWAHELGQFPLRDALSPVGQRNDLVALFSRAFEIAAEQPEKAVLRYAVARVQGLTVSAKGWRAFQNCLLGAVGADPATLAVTLGTLFQVAASSTQTVAKAPLATTFEAVIMTHAPRAQGSEVAWALWGALAWNVPLSDAAAKFVSTMDDDVVALLALDADAGGLFPPGSLDKQHWVKAVSHPDVLHGEHWLLAYEGHRQKWLNVSAVKGHPVFKAMHVAGVSFYDRSKNVPQFPAGARGIPGGTLPDFYA